jgi:hypothetical protein
LKEKQKREIVGMESGQGAASVYWDILCVERIAMVEDGLRKDERSW